ncbi:MAG: PAS domain-containing protein, partial [Gammaproteobacteria bacterium]|nr:PAS domain-containing protein [Gammaproteobacteria bacterium]
YWPAVFIGIGLLAHHNEIPFNVALIAASGNTLEALLAWYLLKKVNFKLSFSKVRQVNYFFTIAISASLVSATLGAIAMIVEMSSTWSDFGFIWAMWWLGDMTGILLIVPLFLVWGASGLGFTVNKCQLECNSINNTNKDEMDCEKQSLLNSIQMFSVLVLLALVSWYSFTPHDLGSTGQLALFYLIMPLTVLAAIIWSQKGATLATLVIASVLLSTYHPQWDTFSITDERLNLLLVIAFIGITALTSLVVAALFSERHEAECSLIQSHENLVESEQRLRQLSENIKEVFWLTDVKLSKFIYVSPSYEDVWGIPVTELLSQSDIWIRAMHPEDVNRVVDAFEIFKKGGAFDVEYRIIRRDGSVRWIHDKGFPVKNENGELYRWAGVAEDITERKEAEQNNKKQNEEMARLSRYISVGELGTSLAHEISQPLTSIVCYTEGALTRLAADKLSKNDLETTFKNLSAEATRAGNIVKKIRSFVNRQEIQLSRIEIHNVLQDVLELIKGKAKDESVTISCNFFPSLNYVIADSVLLQQAILNLLLNAIEAMRDTRPENRRIYLSTQVDKDIVYVKICDTGPGVAVEDREDIMTPLFTTKDKGIGLGLSISYSIIESVGGRLLNYPNKQEGHCFEINLPLKKD